jgi:transposase-like protein
MSVAEQRYEAVRAVIADGETVTDVAARFGVSRKAMHVWLARYEHGGLDGLDRPPASPHQ